MENRYKLPNGLQRKYLAKVEEISGFKSEELAKIFGIVGRSYRDWKREKFSITQRAVKTIETRFHLKFPYSKETALNEWRKNKINASRKGGLAVIRRYGSLGTPEGRSKGGKHAMAILRSRGLIPQPKPFFTPNGNSPELAEFVGMLLGDGHIGKGQWSITLNSIADRNYVDFVTTLVENLFKFKPSVYRRKNMNSIIISGSSVNSIKYFQKLGLKTGNKVQQQVGVPEWIKKDKLLSKSCLRGLMDTDGGIFVHKYKVNGKVYKYQKLCFVNRSVSLLNFVYETLNMFGFNPKMIVKIENKRVWLYNNQEVKRYLQEVGTNNPRLLKAFEEGYG